VNLASGVIFLILGVAIWLLTPTQVKVGFSASQYSLGSRGLPYLTASIMVITSIVVIIRSLVFKMDKVIVIELRDELRAFGFYGMVLVSILIMDTVGFLISGLLIGWSTLLYVRVKKISYYLYIGGFAAFIYFTFVYALNIRLPAGVILGV
jgi:hypothetical protein